MDSSLNSLFCNLKVISQIEPGQKLYVFGENLVIDEPGISSPFVRWLYSENRENTLKFISGLVKKSIQAGNNAVMSESGQSLKFLENSETSIKLRVWELDRDRETTTNNVEFLERLILEMSGMVRGINSLKNTYGTDLTICSKLELEIQNINANIDKFKNFLTS